MNFQRFYARLGRIAHWLATPFFRLYLRPDHRRVRVLVLNNQGEILLVRSWLGHQKWSLPGGGIGRRETPAQAGARELHEETGVRAPSTELRALGQFANADSSAPFIIDCHLVTVSTQKVGFKGIRRLELLEVAWWPLGALPEPRSQTVDRALHLYKKTLR